MKVKAAVLYKERTPLVVEELEQDSPGAREVRVKIAASGVCHSDLHYIKGESFLPFPVVLGHEVSGVVVETGPGVTMVKVGDHIIGSWFPNCGFCYYCATGRPQLCETYRALRGPLLDGTTRLHNGRGQEVWVMGKLGGFAQYGVMPEQGAVPIRSDMPLEPACLIGCGVTTAYGAVVNRAKVEAGSSAMVVGCGGVGLNVIQFLRMVGAARIIAVDLLDNKLEYARQFGATHTINGSREDVVKRAKELCDGEGPDYAFEVIGNVKALRQCYDAIRPDGLVCMVGMPPVGTEASIDPRALTFQEKSITGTLYGSSRPRVDFPRLAELYLDGRLKIDELITRRWRLEQINEAFDALQRGEVARSIIVFE